jgi:hypothetical protein
VFCPKLVEIEGTYQESVDFLGGFEWCMHLVQLNLSSLTKVGTKGFTNCYKIKELNLPNLITVGKEGF